MRRVLRLRAVMYSMVGVICVVANFAAFNLLLALDVPATIANTAAFVAGGQLSFLLHDRGTFRDRSPGLVGPWGRWTLFMSGNLASLGVNSFVATILFASGLPVLVAYWVALATSGLFSFTWNNLVSHRDRSCAENENRP